MGTESSGLGPELYGRITQLSEEGNALADSGDTLGAWKKFVEALNLVPEPQTDNEATTWLLASIGDMAFQRGKFEQAIDALLDAMKCSGNRNVFIHLRLGECFFELRDEKRSADNLTRAYMGGGREAFKDQDPKYFALLERLLKPPLGQGTLVADGAFRAPFLAFTSFSGKHRQFSLHGCFGVRNSSSSCSIHASRIHLPRRCWGRRRI